MDFCTGCIAVFVGYDLVLAMSCFTGYDLVLAMTFCNGYMPVCIGCGILHVNLISNSKMKKCIS